jgi:hypothetical protein
MKIDCSVLDCAIGSIYQAHKNEFVEQIVGKILTDLVECSYVDDKFGHLIYDQESGDYKPDGGIETDEMIQDQLADYIAEYINKQN